jgi:hypothetical protein
MSSILDLEQCLRVAFWGEEESDVQSEVYMWAILEGLSRTTWGKNWYEEFAERPLVCIKGCEICDGDTYFLFGSNRARSTGVPMCAACVARILYAEEVWTLPPVLHDGWEKNQAHPLPASKDEPRAPNST